MLTQASSDSGRFLVPKWPILEVKTNLHRSWIYINQLARALIETLTLDQRMLSFWSPK